MPLDTILIALTSSGFLLGIAVIIKTILDYRAGVRSSEDESSSAHFRRLEERITNLERYTSVLETRLHYKDMYISQLITHINLGLGPPPPEQKFYNPDNPTG